MTGGFLVKSLNRIFLSICIVTSICCIYIKLNVIYCTVLIDCIEITET